MWLERCLLIAALWSISVFGQTIDWTRAPNCYIFTGKNQKGQDVDGLYIPVKKAYDMWSKGGEFMLTDQGNYTPIPTGGTATVSLYWEDEIGLIKSVLLEGTGELAKIKVLINKMKEGNAVIAFKVNGIIYWSWHVWVTDDPTIDGSTYRHGFEKDKNGTIVSDWRWMDRNLGATNDKILGHDWDKSKGLKYEWGRKDPFPEFKINGEITNVASHNDYKNPVPVKFRGNVQPPDQYGINHNTGTDTPNGNIRYSINNPAHYIVTPVYVYFKGETYVDNGENALKQGFNDKWQPVWYTTWFSNKKLRIYDPNNYYNNVFWDLWGDTRAGKWSNLYTRDATVAEESKRYSMKSSYDPCPGGWRVPSFYSTVNTNYEASPWGKKNTNSFSEFFPNVPNTDFPGSKIYPSYGYDLTGVPDRNLGVFPINGNYEFYPNPVMMALSPNVTRTSEKLYLSRPISSIYGPYTVLQDGQTDGGLHSSTFTTVYPVTDLGTMGFGYVANSGNIWGHSNFGWHYLASSAWGNTFEAGGVRCIKDPNNAYMPNVFDTEFIATPPTEFSLEELKVWTKDPNCYIEYTNPTLMPPNAADKDRIIDIPLRKAYAMYKLHYSLNNAFPLGSIKSSSVVWTTDTTLISKLQIIDGTMTTAKLRVTLNENRFGNAVVAFHLGNSGWITGNNNNPDPIIWSWHIWAPQTVVQPHATYTTESIANGGIRTESSGHFVNSVYSYYGVPMNTTVMDRDLGAQVPFLDQHFVADSWTDFMYNPNNPTDVSSLRMLRIRGSGGMHFQWGRKDPIPVFKYPGGFYELPTAGAARDKFPLYSVYKQTGLDSNGNIVYGVTVDETNYLANYAKAYSTYSSGVTVSDSTFDKIKKVLAYSVANPFAYMYQPESSPSFDWLSNESGMFPDRWGVHTEKSPYDPCPQGYRIPDGMWNGLFWDQHIDGWHQWMEGNSPWYYTGVFNQSGVTVHGLDPSNYNLYVNNEPYDPNKMNYIGGYVRSTSKTGRPNIRYGYVFNRPEYNIGNYPHNYVRGMNGGNVLNTIRSGIWTAAPIAPDYAYAFGMLFNPEITQNLGPNQKLFFSTPTFNFRPSSAMSVRCAKIEYDANGKEKGRYDP